MVAAAGCSGDRRAGAAPWWRHRLGERWLLLQAAVVIVVLVLSLVAPQCGFRFWLRKSPRSRKRTYGPAVFVLCSPCHVGGGREAGMHSTTRVNGFLGIQREDIHTGA